MHQETPEKKEVVTKVFSLFPKKLLLEQRESEVVKSAV
ncbi:hypothetical protein A5860_001663 [Enterococcus faecium]|nr:hypothetical protein A5836_000912 [Enterococcus faecium]OTO99921.1 hypothetical protein A5860_001663 [Enterococcus faecium]